jgi:hypothetical protein
MIVTALLLATAAQSVAGYSVAPGDVLVRPLMGASVNVVRLPAATRATPQGGMLMGIDVDWSFNGALAVTAALRPVLSPNYVDGNLGIGAKYRVVQLNAPFLPYASAMVTTAFGGPLGAGDVHINAGLRLAGGIDYFVMRDLAVGLEMASELSALFVPVARPEASTEIVAGVTLRL